MELCTFIEIAGKVFNQRINQSVLGSKNFSAIDTFRSFKHCNANTFKTI